MSVLYRVDRHEADGVHRAVTACADRDVAEQTAASLTAGGSASYSVTGLDGDEAAGLLADLLGERHLADPGRGAAATARVSRHAAAAAARAILASGLPAPAALRAAQATTG